MASADEIRQSQRTTWSALSTSWEKWDALLMAQMHPVSVAMLSRLAIGPRQQHLDIAAGTGEPGPTDPDAPNMFRWAAPGCMARLFEAAGLVDVDEWDVGVALVTHSPAEYWAVMSEHVSIAAAVLRSVDDATRHRIATVAMNEVRAFEHDGRIRVPGRARCTVGSKQPVP